MYSQRNIFVASTVLGLLLGLAVIQQRHDDAPRVDVRDDPQMSIDDADTAQQVAPAPARTAGQTQSSESTTDADDETTGMCVQTLQDVTKFAQLEENAANPQDFEMSEVEWEDLPRILAGSPDPDLFLTAFLLDQPEAQLSDDSSAIARLLEFGNRAANSDSPLLAWHALRACVEAEENCPYPGHEQRLLEAQQDNAEAWALAATLRYRRGDRAGALAAMQNAGRASTSTWYWAETADLIERSLAEQTSIPFESRAENAFAVAGSAFPPWARAFRCARTSPPRAVLGHKPVSRSVNCRRSTMRRRWRARFPTPCASRH